MGVFVDPDSSAEQTIIVVRNTEILGKIAKRNSLTTEVIISIVPADWFPSNAPQTFVSWWLLLEITASEALTTGSP